MGLNASYVGLRREIWTRVPESADRILDVGASDGTLGAFLLEQKAGREVFGVEMDEGMAARAADRLTGVFQGDVESLDWGSVGGEGSFDCMIFADVLEHLVDPWSALRDAAARLSSGGRMVISLPNIRHVSAWWSIFVAGTFPRRTRGVFDETHLRWFTPRDARALCNSAGLQVESIDYNFRFFDKVGGLVNRAVAMQRWMKWVPGMRDVLAYQIVIVASRR